LEEERISIMAKRTISVGAVLFVLALVMAGSARAASTYTISCQGLDVGLKGPTATTGLGLGSDSAIWSVLVSGSKFVSGTSTTMYTNNPGASGSPALTCNYTLDSSSTFTTVNGAVMQTLVWDSLGSNAGGCTNGSPAFTDHVYLNSNSLVPGMIDDNLENDNVAGSGVCTSH
ncbi:MAG: hypothetical protein ACHQZS_01920, partial [Candidatus Binatales bacterium]